VALAQVGEFSFVLAGMGVRLDLMTEDTYNLILASALISIAINPILFRIGESIAQRAEARAEPA
jgi:CPA2 family monovalent cation:H+ antiporter-2